jgi:hypothetical protein
MKCINCPASWSDEDDGGCFINKLEEKKNGEYKQGCKLGLKKVAQLIEEFKQQRDDFYEGFIEFIKHQED